MGGGMGGGPGQANQAKFVEDQKALHTKAAEDLRKRFLDARRKLTALELNLALNKSKFNELTNDAATSADLERRVRELEAVLKRLNAGKPGK